MEEIISNKGLAVVDVRTHSEFARGHIEGSINIPLNEIESRINEIKKIDKAIFLCCASGVRSTQAYHILIQHGMNDVYNGGSWVMLQNKLIDIKQSI